MKRLRFVEMMQDQLWFCCTHLHLSNALMDVDSHIKAIRSNTWAVFYRVNNASLFSEWSLASCSVQQSCSEILIAISLHLSSRSRLLMRGFEATACFTPVCFLWAPAGMALDIYLNLKTCSLKIELPSLLIRKPTKKQTIIGSLMLRQYTCRFQSWTLKVKYKIPRTCTCVVFI